MPAFAALSAAKLESLLAYLRSLQGFDPKQLASGDPNQGRELFFQKDGCAGCHAVNGDGGFLAPDLSIYGAITPFLEMREQIAHHDRSPRARTVTVAIRDGQSFTGIVRNEDNFSLQLQTLDGNFHFLDRSTLIGVDLGRSATAAGQKPTLSNDDVAALVSYLVDLAKNSNAHGQLKRRPVHREEED